MGKKTLNILFFSIIISPSFSQTGGDNIYEFLNLTHSGLVSALGGTNVSLPGYNLNLAYHNPALLNSGMNKTLALNYVNYFAGINYGLAMYSRSYPGTGNFATGLTYLNYGTFTESNASGIITGDFNAAEYAFSFIYSREIDSLFTLGVNFKPVLSQLEKYYTHRASCYATGQFIFSEIICAEYTFSDSSFNCRYVCLRIINMSFRDFNLRIFPIENPG